MTADIADLPDLLYVLLNQQRPRRLVLYHPMNAKTLQEIYDAKQARRGDLARLSMDERVDLIESLHDLAETMMEARKHMRAADKATPASPRDPV